MTTRPRRPPPATAGRAAAAPGTRASRPPRPCGSCPSAARSADRTWPCTGSLRAAISQRRRPPAARAVCPKGPCGARSRVRRRRTLVMGADLLQDRGQRHGCHGGCAAHAQRRRSGAARQRAYRPKRGFLAFWHVPAEAARRLQSCCARRARGSCAHNTPTRGNAAARGGGFCFRPASAPPATSADDHSADGFVGLRRASAEAFVVRGSTRAPLCLKCAVHSQRHTKHQQKCTPHACRRARPPPCPQARGHSRQAPGKAHPARPRAPPASPRRAQGRREQAAGHPWQPPEQHRHQQQLLRSGCAQSRSAQSRRRQRMCSPAQHTPPSEL